MICFLTSNPCITNTNKINKNNKLEENLKLFLDKELKITFIASNPMNHKESLKYINNYIECLISLGYVIKKNNLLDDLNKENAKAIIDDSNLVILCGGHAPTQNQFFIDINLKNLLNGYKKVLIGISAGSMNSCNNVYAIPEEKGEAISKTYNRFLNGLNLTNITIIADHKKIEEEELDGLKLIDDIMIPDSIDKEFYIFKDGTYLLIKNHKQTIYGLTYLIKNKEIIKLIDNDETLTIK